MKFGLDVPNYGEYSDIHLLVDMAVEAEKAGWDCFMISDHDAAEGRCPITDPWIASAAIAVKTEKIQISTMVTQFGRRRPWKIGRESAALDQLSNGRFILGIGMGLSYEREFKKFTRTEDDSTRKEMLDEALEVLSILWSEVEFKFSGKHYQVETNGSAKNIWRNVYIPVWVAGMWPNPQQFKRAANWHGVYPVGKGYEYNQMLPAALYPELIKFLYKHRTSRDALEVIHLGRMEADDSQTALETVKEYEEVGVTWWMEHIFPGRGEVDEMMAIIKKGPPRA